MAVLAAVMAVAAWPTDGRGRVVPVVSGRSL